MKKLSLTTLLLMLATICLGSEVKFSSKPVAKKAGEKITVSFILSKAADVEVAILDTKGAVVRRLAAGMLGGKKAPPKPLKAGLSQSVTWDGKDDYGKKITAAGPFKVRVRAGIKGEFDGFMLYEPDACGPISMLAVGPKRNVYLFHQDATVLQTHWGCKKIKIMSPEGRHVRALTPYPADINPERVKSTQPFKDADGDLMPRVHHLRRLRIYPGAGHKFPGNSCPVVDAKGRVYWLVLGPALACVDADGGVPADGQVGPKLLANIKDLHMRGGYTFGRDVPVLAMSSDGKYIYFAGLGTGKYGSKAKRTPLPCVFRVDAATRSKAEVFLGKLGSPGKEKGLLTSPRGIAVAKGLVYVADRAANRVVVFKEADKSYVGEIKVKNPQIVGVDPQSGAVYVCRYLSMKAAELAKYDGYKNGKELYKLALPTTGLNPNSGVHRIAVDASAKPVRIWMPNLPYGRPVCPLKCIEDDGTKFVDKGDPRKLKGKQWAEGPRDMSIDRKRGELYIKSTRQQWYRVDEKTGKVKNLFRLNNIHKYNLHSNANGSQIAVAPDGNIISLNWSKGLIYHDRAGKPIHWPGRKTDQIPYGGLMNFMQRVLAVTPDKEIYAVLPNRYGMTKGQPAKTIKHKSRIHAVSVLGFDGMPKRTAIWSCTHGVVMKLDHKGNIYLGEPVRPVGRWYPKFFDGKIPNPKRNLTPGEGKDVFWNSYMYASIVKFPPSGGAIWYTSNGYGKTPSPSAVGKPPAALLAKPVIKAQAHLVYAHKAPAEIQGAEWSRFGFAPYSMHSGSDTCMCEGAGFDIDLYGRVFYPNLGQFRIEYVDAANNALGHFGKYGNQDSTGARPGEKSKSPADSAKKGRAAVSKPDIPMAWPITCVASDTHVYVGDTVNRRVVKVKLAATVEETVDCK